MAKPINIFIIYAREDKEIKQRILDYLTPFAKPYNLTIWHDDHIEPGQEWKPHIESRLTQTDVFLLLVSIDFMNSQFINQVEFKYAVERHRENKSIVVPVIIDYCPWDIEFVFNDANFNLSQLQVLPEQGLPIDGWKTPEQAYNNIAAGIRKVVTSIKSSQQQQESVPAEDSAANKETAKKRMLKNNFIVAGVFILFIIIFWVIYKASSGNKDIPLNSQLVDSITLSNGLYIGVAYKGGIIFHLDSTGKHGLIAAPKDLGDLDWAAAMQKCIDLGDNWRLPDKEELDTLFSTSYTVGGFSNSGYWSSTEQKGSYIMNALDTSRVLFPLLHLDSTFDDGSRDYAWYKNFGNSRQEFCLKTLANRVRAIRAF